MFYHMRYIGEPALYSENYLKGQKGEQGFSGNPGLQGLHGEGGPRGPPGNDGPRGYPGIKGTAGCKHSHKKYLILSSLLFAIIPCSK